MTATVQLAPAKERATSFAITGQSSMEYLVVCAALAFALGVAMWNDNSVLRELLQAFQVAYEKISYALSIPL
jgi:hypothetical protein